jgi:hypothetical protein
MTEEQWRLYQRQLVERWLLIPAVSERWSAWTLARRLIAVGKGWQEAEGWMRQGFVLDTVAWKWEGGAS